MGIPGMIFAGFILDRTHRYFEVSMLFLVLGVLFLALFTFAVQVPASQGYGYALLTSAFAAAGIALGALQPALLEFVAEASFPANEGMSCMLLFWVRQNCTDSLPLFLV